MIKSSSIQQRSRLMTTDKEIIWVIKSRRTGYITNTELVKQVQLHVEKVRWLCILAKSAFPPLCYECSFTGSFWEPGTSQSPSQFIESVRTRNHWGYWCRQTPGDICTSIRPRGRTILKSGSSTHRTGTGSSGQWELWDSNKEGDERTIKHTSSVSVLRAWILNEWD